MALHIVELALNRRAGLAGIYQQRRYAKEVREAFELWSRHIEARTGEKPLPREAQAVASNFFAPL